MNREAYEFKNLRLDVSERLLWREGDRVPLSDKGFETLCILVRHHNHLVTREELIGEVWANAIVEENNLDKTISLLRDVLGERSGQGKFIETVRGHGYRFVPGVKVSDSKIKTIAVLPFKPLVETNRNEALEIGMADTLISRLGSNQKLIVRPLSAVRKYGGLEQDAAAAGRELDVDTVIDGCIQHAGGNIRIKVQLIKVTDGTSLWTGTFEEKFTNIFIVQDTISNKVTASITFELGGYDQKQLYKRYTENVEAYQCYLIGRFHWNKRTPQELWKSIEHYRQAIALDPNYALAFAGIADSYTLLANAGSPAHEIMPKAREAALTAVYLDDSLAEAHAALGNTIIYYDYDFVGGEREHKRAIELDPNYTTAHHWYSELLMGLGRHEEALAEIRRALEIDPLSLILNRQYGASLLFARQYDAAIAQMKKTVELDADFAVGHSTLSVAYRMIGSYAESVEELSKFQDLTGGEQTASIMRESFARGGWEGFLRAMTGKPKPTNITPYNMATFHAAVGEKDEALNELNTAYRNREGILGLVKVDPRFDSLHDDSRFIALIKQMNFE